MFSTSVWGKYLRFLNLASPSILCARIIVAVEYGLYGDLTDWVSDFNIDVSGFQLRASHSPGNLQARWFSAFSNFSRFPLAFGSRFGESSWVRVPHFRFFRFFVPLGRRSGALALGDRGPLKPICVFLFLFFAV